MYKNALMINTFLYSTVCQESNVGSDGTVQHKGTKTSEWKQKYVTWIR